MITLLQILKRWRMLIPLMMVVVQFGLAQKINFGAYTGSQSINLTVNGSLVFTDMGRIVLSNSNATCTIAFSDNVPYIQIFGDATKDITITITAPSYLTIDAGGAGKQIPFACNFAYSNLGSADAATAKLSAVQVPAGFTAITLPMLKRTAGVPAPPPTPSHGGYSAPTTSVYLYFYGRLGPVGNVNAGYYNGIINVNVNYATY
jgi:hypothetical protein